MRTLKYYILSILPVWLACTACTAGFEDINSEPGGLENEDVPVELRFIQPQQSIYTNFGNKDSEFQLVQNLNADLYSGYLAVPTDFLSNLNNSTYAMSESWNDDALKVGMLYIMKPISTILSVTTVPDYIAVAKIIRVAGMHKVTDKYGPIPYSEAMKGGMSIRYDSEEEIYSSFFADLEESVGILTDIVDKGEGLSSNLSFDCMCGGSYLQWIKFANSLRLRLAMRIVKVAPELAKENAEKAVNHKYGVLEYEDNNVEVVYPTLNNPLRTCCVNYNDCCIGASFESIMKGYNDPRLYKMALPVGWNDNIDIHDANGNNLGKVGEIIGIRQGALVTKPDYRMYSIPYFDVKDGNKSTEKYPLPIMKVAEVYFLRAEGALRGWKMGDTAQNFYERGIQRSFDDYGISIDLYEKYIQDDVSVGADYEDPFNPENNIKAVNDITVKWEDSASDEKNLQRIITQKWIAMFPEGQEAWSEFRRTGYPKLFPVANNYSNGVIEDGEFIKRLPFTRPERNTNLNSVLEAEKMLKGPDNIGTRLWWDIDKGNFE